MWLLVGLGNSGGEYEGTRHNAGFMVVEAVRQVHGLPGWVKKCKGLVSKGKVAGHEVVLLMPQTFMNVSGESVQAALAFYKLGAADLLVVHDELDIPLAQVKYKAGGGDAGHNGLKSITHTLQESGYARLRFGIGRPVHKSQVTDYVLEPFTAGEALTVAERVAWIAEHMGGLLDDPHGTLAGLKNG